MEQAILTGRVDFVIEALTLRSELTAEVVRKIINTASPKAVTALAWKANLSMRTAIQLQSRSARIPPKKMLNARLGTDYPLTPEEMARILAREL